MDIEEVAAKHAREDPQGGDRPGGRPAPLPGAQARLRPRPARRRRSRTPASFLHALYARVRRRPTARCSRSTRWSSPRTATCWRSTRKINFDDNALFRHKDLVELRDLDEEDPAETRGQEARPQLRHARRQHRLHGQRRRPRDGDDGHHQAPRRRAGELPRRRRRRHRGAGHRGVQDHPRRPEGEGDLRQHLRRHHEVRRHRRRASSPRPRRSASRCRSSCASKAPTSSRARRSSPRVGPRDHRRPTTWPTARKKIVAAVGGREAEP